PIAGNVELDMIIHYVELFKPTTIVGLPSMIVQLAERIKNRGINITIEKILYGGEHFSAEAVSFLREILGTRLIHSAGYASVDAGPIGYQCQENIGGVHHQLYEYMFLEILDRQTGEPVADGEVGEIAVTNLNRRLMPIIRYRTGDLGRKLNRGCKCMHGTPLFELMGRCDDALRISGMNVFPRMVLEAITHERKLTPIIQLIASSRNAKDLLTIKIEAGESEADYNELAREARHIILAHNPELDLCEAEDWMFLEVEVVPPGALGKSSRTGKIKAVIDERKKLSE
ncbi:MAG: phenylacetate--CoA ligase family protein, partial [Vulcanimicrobiota bacterium]